MNSDLRPRKAPGNANGRSRAHSSRTVPRVSPEPNAMSSLLERSRSETVPVWVLFPLRAFLGFTFVFAGLQKVSDRQFFTAGAPGSIQLQLQASLRTSPVHFLVNLALHAPVAFGVVIALAEIGIGLGVALGLFSRMAAAGGMLLSLLFFLTVSFNTWPYYYGSDIAFLFAWTPLVLAGSGPLSLDAALQSRARRNVGVPADAPLQGDLGRRALLGQLGAAGVVGAAGLFVAGATAAIGRAANRATSGATGGLTPLGGGTTGTTGKSGSTPGSTSPTSGGTNPSGTAIGKASDVPVGGAASFTDPATRQPAFVVQPSSGDFVAFSAICTHLGCTVGFQPGTPLEFVCPCHGSIYNATTGQVIQGPSVQPLPQIKIAKGSDGNLFADG